MSESTEQGRRGGTGIHISCVPDILHQLWCEMYPSSMSVLEMQGSDANCNLTDQTCTLCFREFVRWERLSESMQVGLASKGAAKASGNARATGHPMDQGEKRGKSHVHPNSQATARRGFCTVGPNEVVCSRDRGMNPFVGHCSGTERNYFFRGSRRARNSFENRTWCLFKCAARQERLTS